MFVAVLPYSQYIYAEGMISTAEPQWIEVNNHALDYFGGVPALVVCDNCKQAVIVNQDWIEPELNKDYADWAEANATICPKGNATDGWYHKWEIGRVYRGKQGARMGQFVCTKCGKQGAKGLPVPL